MGVKFDFSGWATRHNVKCADGRTIRENAFASNDGMIVPLVWNHQRNSPDEVLGHALLENRPEGVYAYCSFNDTEAGQNSKMLVQHGDITQLSIWANKLKQKGSDVLHGAIREVSLVLASANPEAFIDAESISHSEDAENFEATIYSGEDFSLYHAEEKTPPTPEPAKEKKEMPADKTVKEVFDELTEEQKTVVYAMIGAAIEEATGEDGGNSDMKHNIFDQDSMDYSGENFLSHSDMRSIMTDAKKCGSLKDAVLSHADTYGINDIEYLFPDARTLSDTPELLKRKTNWVADVVDGAHHSPFSRIKSIVADITADEARALGYIKGKLKKEEVFSLLKRTTEPTTVYKKQKLDRDDVVDIVDFDVVTFMKGEMRVMLDEEIARAVLVGDGRLSSSDDKIDETHIRPIWKDNELYAINVTVDTPNDAEVFIDTVITEMADYEGSGSPKMFAPQSMITACLLLKDTNKHRLYKTMDELATALQVSKVVPVPVMKNLTREVSGVTRALDAIIVNMSDYNIGADKGGAINMFDDFDIDYNQMKYLMETRCSGALTKPHSALVFEHVVV